VEVWDHEASLTPSFSIEVPVTSQKMTCRISQTQLKWYLNQIITYLL